VAGRPGWINNNVESIKSFNNWRLHKLPDLVRTVKGVVAVQQRQIEQAMYGEGMRIFEMTVDCAKFGLTTHERSSECIEFTCVAS
jgi:hypothetical protein